MKTMMKLLALVLTMMMVLCLVACGNDANPGDTETTGSGETTGPEDTTGDTSETDPPDDGKKAYTIVLKDSNGDPVVGVFVNICKEGASCFVPTATDENGAATWRLEEASDYYGSVTSDTEGVTKTYFNSNFEVTIVYDPPVAE